MNALATTNPDLPDDVLVYTWDLDGDGSFGETGRAATRGDEVGVTPTFDAAGLDGPDSVLVQLQVTDNGGLTNADTATIDVTNSAPTLISVDLDSLAIHENGPVTLSGSFTDPGIEDTHEVQIDWGQERPPTLISLTSDERSFTESHQYLDDPAGTPATPTRSPSV